MTVGFLFGALYKEDYMNHYVLVLNCGSSSVKFNVFAITEQNELDATLQGIAEEIGNPEKSRLKYEDQGEKIIKEAEFNNHQAALLLIFDTLRKHGIDAQHICAVGHRVVHGGEQYCSSVRIDSSVIKTIRKLIPIAPLHNPPNLTGIEESIKLLPDVPQVAVFDTAFHETMPEYAYRYAIPMDWYKKYGVRKYGFHGTSHMYVARRAASLLGIPFDRFNGITAHLGNGCSITKIQSGRSIDTSMGFTPLEGVIMGTRSGDIDPALIGHVAEQLVSDRNISKEQAFESVLYALNKESGLKAIGKTNMMQDIRAKALAGDEAADTVISIYAYRIAKYIGQYWATLPWTDALIFTAGLGENEAYVRKRILAFIQALNISVDDEKNAQRKQEIVIGSSQVNPDHPLSVMVIPTDEEIVIGYDTLYLGYLDQSPPETYPFEKA
jgi:acetate kinase